MRFGSALDSQNGVIEKILRPQRNSTHTSTLKTAKLTSRAHRDTASLVFSPTLGPDILKSTSNHADVGDIVWGQYSFF